MNLGAAAFWIFLAAVVVAANWRMKSREAMRHETLRFLVEKNPNLDQTQIAELLKPPPSPEWLAPKHEPGEGYRILRIFGTILLFVALGFLFASVWRGFLFGMYDKAMIALATMVPIIAAVGVALFVSSRFVTPPLGKNK